MARRMKGRITKTLIPSVYLFVFSFYALCLFVPNNINTQLLRGKSYNGTSPLVVMIYRMAFNYNVSINVNLSDLACEQTIIILLFILCNGHLLISNRNRRCDLVLNWKFMKYF